MPLTTDRKNEAERLFPPHTYPPGESGWPNQHFFRQPEANHDRARHYSHAAGFAKTGSGSGLPPVPRLIFRGLDRPPPDGLPGVFPGQIPNSRAGQSSATASPAGTGEDRPALRRAGADAKTHLPAMVARNVSRLSGISGLGASGYPSDKPVKAAFPAPAASPHSTHVLEQPAPTARPGAAQAPR